VSPRVAGRTEQCGRRQAMARLDQARAFLDVAKLVGDQDDVAASLAVLAGIAASDAVCCVALGRRPRSQDHRQAIDLLRQIAGVGGAMARDLGRLLAIKDDAHYGVLHVSGQRVTAAIRQAGRVVDTAEAFIESS
jgi:hypothetical protein